MRNRILAAVFLLAPFLWQSTATAESPIARFSSMWQNYRQVPTYGSPQSMTAGVPHYDLPSHHYGVWHRPRAFGLQAQQRCAAPPFRPRGTGNLFARPCASHRLDYAAFRLDDPYTIYGPEYHVLQPDPRCDDDCQHGDGH